MSLDLNLEFLGAATAYFAAATAYPVVKPIIRSNPTEVEGSVEVGVELGLWQYFVKHQVDFVLSLSQEEKEEQQEPHQNSTRIWYTIGLQEAVTKFYGRVSYIKLTFKGSLIWLKMMRMHIG